MTSKFIHKNHESKLILFFNGWGMDESIVSHIDSTGYDVCIFYDYDGDFSKDLSEFDSYKEVYIVAWSMGVWGAAKTLQNTSISIDKSIAINGTTQPVDDENGIPTAIFKGTIDNFSERNKQKFDRRMMGSKHDFEQFQKIQNKRTIANQLAELEIIFDLSNNEETSFTFDKAIIGDQDLIIPTNNQMNFWENKTEIVNIESSHFPFFKFKTWEEILRL